MRSSSYIRYLIVFLIFVILLICYEIFILGRCFNLYNNDLKSFKPSSHLNIYSIEDSYKNKQFSFENINTDFFKGERIVHIDLKGAPPSINYLKQLFPLLHALNVSSLLLEYEDMFPYSTKYTHVVNSYSKKDLRHLINFAKRNKLNVIPLVQTFGHLEFLLKTRKFRYLRELDQYPQSICPSHKDTLSIITGMLDEVIAMHPDIKYIHIGCDEVYQIGICNNCANTMIQYQWNVKDLFLFHVTKIAKYIRKTYPHITPLMWDDELRSISFESLQKFEIGILVEPVVWCYKPTISFTNDIWEKYSKVFSTVWVASSFKGATGPNQILPNISFHLENHRSWLSLMKNFSHLITFKGIIITGWQRYDHFSVLCELLPASLPSLVNCLLLIAGNQSLIMNTKKVQDIVACGKNYKFTQTCEFPGADLYHAIIRLSHLISEIDKVLESSIIKGWLSDYNVQRGYFNPLLLDELTYKINDCQNNLKRYKFILTAELNKIYDSHTVEEWTETYVTPYVIKLDNILNIIHNIINIAEWPLRPIGTFKEGNNE